MPTESGPSHRFGESKMVENRRTSRMSRRWAVWAGIAAVLLAASPGQRAGAGEPLETLLKDYQVYELPMPPAEATLAIVSGRTVSFSNGVREQKHHLVLLIQQAGPKDRAGSTPQRSRDARLPWPERLRPPCA